MKPSSSGGSGGPRDSYHHGALRDALIVAADQILGERGPEGFSLREAARRAGVSAGAPAHHFGSTAGLLTEVAILGFDGLRNALREAGEAAPTPGARLRAQGVAYVRFALAHRGRFQLMFRHDLLQPDNERLESVGSAALAELETSIRTYLGADKTANPKVLRAMVLNAWSTVHGFAHLALDGKFSSFAHPQSLNDFVSETLEEMLGIAWPDS